MVFLSFTSISHCTFRIVAVQGLGSGGIATMTYTILADLVPLKERGMFNGLIAV